MEPGLPSQEGSEGNVAKKKNVKESMEANLGKVLKYNVDKVVSDSRVPSQEGSEGNVAKKKNVKESMEANLGKVLKYNVDKVVSGS
nr:hypothetical protein [Tanacetum cinerariifolium]